MDKGLKGKHDSLYIHVQGILQGDLSVPLLEVIQQSTEQFKNNLQEIAHQNQQLIKETENQQLKIFEDSEAFVKLNEMLTTIDENLFSQNIPKYEHSVLQKVKDKISTQKYGKSETTNEISSYYSNFFTKKRMETKTNCSLPSISEQILQNIEKKLLDSINTMYDEIAITAFSLDKYRFIYAFLSLIIQDSSIWDKRQFKRKSVEFISKTN